MDPSMGIARTTGVPWCAPSDPAPSTRAWAFSRQGSPPGSMRAWALPAVAEAKVHASMGIARQASTRAWVLPDGSEQCGSWQNPNDPTSRSDACEDLLRSDTQLILKRFIFWVL